MSISRTQADIWFQLGGVGDATRRPLEVTLPPGERALCRAMRVAEPGAALAIRARNDRVEPSALAHLASWSTVHRTGLRASQGARPTLSLQPLNAVVGRASRAAARGGCSVARHAQGRGYHRAAPGRGAGAALAPAPCGFVDPAERCLRCMRSTLGCTTRWRAPFARLREPARATRRAACTLPWRRRSSSCVTTACISVAPISRRALRELDPGRDRGRVR